jgi:hypothetical protein
VSIPFPLPQHLLLISILTKHHSRASIANFIRLASLVKLKTSNDQLFDAAPVFLWSAVEVSIGISVAGIIELRPLMQRYNVKGFEMNSGQMEDDSRPIVRLRSMDKSTISFPLERENVKGVEEGEERRL